MYVQELILMAIVVRCLHENDINIRTINSYLGYLTFTRTWNGSQFHYCEREILHYTQDKNYKKQ